MIVDSIDLNNFRSWKRLHLKLSDQLNLFLGMNGQGKTNLLEAIYLSSKAETFRFAKNSDLINQDNNEGSVKTNIKSKDGFRKYEIKTILRPAKKELFLNQKKSSATNIQKVFSVILFSPESLSAIKDGNEQRRILIDDLLGSSAISSLDIIADFKKVLKTRNKVLRNFKDQQTDLKQTQQILESLDPSFISASLNLAMARIQALNSLRDRLQAIGRELYQENVDIAVEYVVSDKIASSWQSAELLDSMHQRLLQLRSAELASGVSLVGPHKHDIRFVYNGKDSRSHCSQGQQRGLILSFKMAQIVYHRELRGDEPVLLLDDVMSELDAKKQESLVNFLRNINSQIILTSTEVNLKNIFSGQEKSATAVFNLSRGQVDERPSL